MVRQAARRSLVILSYFALQQEGVAREVVANNQTGPSVIVDFGPAAGADRAGRETSAGKWKDWWDEHGIASSKQRQLNASLGDATLDAEAARLSAALVFVPSERQAAELARYVKEKGVVYTEALADALPQLQGSIQRTAREALVDRLYRMTAETLRNRLTDPRPEMRRAAALAWASKDDRAAIPALIPLLADADEHVVNAAKAGLKSLTAQDFGPARTATEAERAAAVSAWMAWWKKQP
jgi:hypothetical protein